MSRMSLCQSHAARVREIERLIDRVGKGASDGYPHNIERIAKDERGELLRITLAEAGFT